MLVPGTPSRYDEFAPLYHLLKRDTCEMFGLPLLARGCWPLVMELGTRVSRLPGQ
jgi:hypothetical protein